MKRIHILAVLSLLVGLLSCAKEEGLPRLGKGEKVPASFGFVQELPKDIQTKTVIDSPSSFESKFTSITYGVYSGGRLYSSAFFSDAEGNLDSASTGVTLEKGFTFTVYAFVNMGDLREALPASESAVSSMVYTIPAYKNSTVSDVNTRGIPMSGKITVSPTGDALSETVSLRRLLARVTATLRCEWDGARIQEARVYNLNSRLKPFGTSAAESTGDILPFQDIQTGSDATTLTATFYVPENMQGVFSGITASDDKERNNALVTGIAGRLTYLETTVVSTGRYEGTVKYRSYLGSNATSSFNIERNAHYHWTINYRSEKVDDYDNDWKHDMGGGLTVKDYSIVVSPNPLDLGVGDVQTLSTLLRTTVENPVPGTTSSVLSNGSCTWESSDPTVASVSSTGVVTALKAGTATITARYTPSGYDFSQVSATTVVNVSDVVSNYIEILGGDSPSTVGTDIQLSAKYHTVTNGVDDGGVDITSDPSASWSKTEGPSCITVGTHTGTVASVTPGGTAVIRCSYAGTYAEKSVSFSSVVSYRLEVTATPSAVDMGSSIQMSAKFYTTTDGVEDAGVTVTSQTAWSRYSGDAVSVSAAGVVSSPVAATAVINGRYIRDGVEYNAQAGVTFNHVATISHTLVISGPSSANVGETLSLTATYYTYTDGVPDSGVDKTSEAIWTRKSGSANVTVGNASGTKGKVSAVSPGGSATVSCSLGTVTSNDFDVTFASVVDYELEVSATPSSQKVGSPVQMSARLNTIIDGTDHWEDLPASSVSWSRKSGSANVSVVASTGVVTNTVGAASALIEGSYTIASRTVKASATVTFMDVITYGLEIVPSGATSANVGQTIVLLAKYYTFTNGVKTSTSDVTEAATWSVLSGGSRFHVTKGSVTADSPGGNATIKCTYGDYSDDQAVSFGSVVTHRLVVSSSPSPATVDMGGTIQMSARFYTPTDGVEDSGVVVTAVSGMSWTKVSGGASISVGSDGKVTSPSAATGVVRGTYTYEGENYSGEDVTVTFNHVAAITRSLVISGTFSANVGTDISLTATYNVYSDGVLQSSTPVTASVTWTKSSGDANITIPSKGTVRCTNPTGSLDARTAVITASYNDGGIVTEASGVTVTFNPVVTYIVEVSASSASASVGQSIQMSARQKRVVDTVTTYTDLTANQVSWSPSSGTIRVNASGVVTATAGGTQTITGTYTTPGGSRSGSASVTFNDVVENYIEIVAATSTTRNVGETITLKAYYHTVTNDVDDGGVEVTSHASASWSMKSGSNSHISVGAHTGLVTASSAGTTSNLTGTVVVSYGGKSVEQAVVFKPVGSKRLEVSAPSYSVNENETIQMSAKLYTTIDSVEDSGVNVTTSSSWVKSGSSSITVGNSSGTKGLVSATGAGTASITATYNDGSKNYSDTKDVTFVHVPVISHKLVITGENSANVGTPINLTATYYTYSDDAQTASQVVTTASGVAWTRSAGSSLVSVGSASGVVSCSNPEGLTGAKTATIKVSYAGIVSEGFIVTFNPVVTKVLTVTATPSTQNVNSTIQMSASLKTTVDGVVKNSSPSASNVTWTRLSGGTNASRISVNASGVVSNTTGAATGTIQGTYDGVSGTAAVTFNDVVTHSLVVTAPGGLTGTVGDNISLVATYYTYLNGSSTPSSTQVVTTNGSLTWSKLSSGLTGEGNLSIGAHTGVVTATSEGSAKFRAQYQGETSNEVTVSFGNSIVKELIVSASPSTQTVGNQIQLSAQLKTTVNGGTPTLQNVSATWSALNSGTNYGNISVNASTGVVSNTTGAATRVIRGTYDGVTGDVTVTFTDRIEYELELTPETTTGVSVGTTVNLTAKYYTLVNGSRTTFTDVTTSGSTVWTSSNTNMSVSAGVVSAAQYGGTTTITARYAGKQDTATVTYNDVTEYVYSLEVSPASLQVKVSKYASVNVYLVAQRKVNGFPQTVLDSDKSLVSASSWSSSNSAKAVWDAAEAKIKGVEDGTATLTASYTCPDSVVRTASVSVTVLPLNSGFDDDWDDGGEINL